MADQVRNPEDRFSHNEAHIVFVVEQACLCKRSCKCSPDIWAYYKYKNKFPQFDIVLNWVKVNSGSSFI